MDLGGGLAGMCCVHIREAVALWTCNDIQDLSEDGSILEKGHLVNCVVKDTSFCVSTLWHTTKIVWCCNGPCICGKLYILKTALSVSCVPL